MKQWTCDVCINFQKIIKLSPVHCRKTVEINEIPQSRLLVPISNGIIPECTFGKCRKNKGEEYHKKAIVITLITAKVDTRDYTSLRGLHRPELNNRSATISDAMSNQLCNPVVWNLGAIGIGLKARGMVSCGAAC